MKTVRISVLGVAAALLGLAFGGSQSLAASPCIAAGRANFAATSYAATITTHRAGKTSTSTIEIQKPDRFHETGPGQEMIAVGSKTWMRMGGGPWKALPESNAASFLTMDPGAYFKPKAGASCVDAGMGVWQGQPAHVFKGVYPGKTGTIHSTVYVMSDGFNHHMDVSSPQGTTSMDFSRFNAVTVSAP